MDWKLAKNFRMRPIALTAAVTAFAVFPGSAMAWGRNAHRLIVNKAVDTLPADIRPFFEANRGFLMQPVTDPLDALAKNPSERRNNFIPLDKYGRFPFLALPRSYKPAVTHSTKLTLTPNGLP